MTSGCKVCPLSGMECRTDCGWNTGKGCAVALLPRRLEDIAREIQSHEVDLSAITESLDSISEAINRK